MVFGHGRRHHRQHEHHRHIRFHEDARLEDIPPRTPVGERGARGGLGRGGAWAVFSGILRHNHVRHGGLHEEGGGAALPLFQANSGSSKYVELDSNEASTDTQSRGGGVGLGVGDEEAGLLSEEAMASLLQPQPQHEASALQEASQPQRPPPISTDQDGGANGPIFTLASVGATDPPPSSSAPPTPTPTPKPLATVGGPAKLPPRRPSLANLSSTTSAPNTPRPRAAGRGSSFGSSVPSSGGGGGRAFASAAKSGLRKVIKIKRGRGGNSGTRRPSSSEATIRAVGTNMASSDDHDRPNFRSASAEDGPDTVAVGGGVSAIVRSISNQRVAGLSPPGSPPVLTRPVVGVASVAGEAAAIRPNQDNDIGVVQDLESVLRRALILSGAYALGVATGPRYLPVVFKLIEILTVAWVTCGTILGLVWAKRRRMSDMRQALGRSISDYGSTVTNQTPGADRRPLNSSLNSSAAQSTETAPLLESDETHAQNTSEPSYHEEQSREVFLDGTTQAHQTFEEPSTHTATEDRKGPEEVCMPHPALDNLYMIDADILERFVPNSKPVMFDNDLFHGRMLLMIRTPDADGDTGGHTDGGDEQNDAVSDYLRPKSRRFEFQYQIKLKKKPTGPLFMAVNWATPIKLGMVQRAFVGATLNFIKKMNNGFHYSLSGPEDASKTAIKDGRYQNAHVAFSLEASMDRLVATRAGESPPKLGEAIYEDPESIKQRKRGGGVDWNTEDTYTMGLWSAYFDFLQWKCLNFPAIRPFSLVSILGPQHLQLSMYCLNEQEEASSSKGNGAAKSRPHYVCDITSFVNTEISNKGFCDLGPCAEKSMARLKAGNTGRVVVGSPPTGEEKNAEESAHIVDGEETDEGEESDLTDEEHEPPLLEDDDDAAAEELGEGIYLKSGDQIFLREASVAGTEDNAGLEGNGMFLSDGGGFAVLQSQYASKVIVVRVSSPKRGDAEYNKTQMGQPHSKLIKSGDVVRIKLIVQKEGESDDVKYLSIHRGWWLKWVSHPPKHNGLFTIFAEGESLEEDVLEPSTDFVRLGCPFLLRHRRWKQYEVGASLNRSARYGGLMLGLRKRSAPTASIDDDGDTMDIEDHPRDHDFESHPEDSTVDAKGKRQWMRPLRLCANLPVTTGLGVLGVSDFARSFQTSPDDSLKEMPKAEEESVGKDVHHLLDAPAWVEMMHRTKRQRQRVYVVRVRQNSDQFRTPLSNEKSAAEDENSESPAMVVTESLSDGDNVKTHDLCSECPRPYFRMRTGKELAPILQLGLSRRNPTSGSFDPFPKQPPTIEDDGAAGDDKKKSKHPEGVAGLIESNMDLLLDDSLEIYNKSQMAFSGGKDHAGQNVSAALPAQPQTPKKAAQRSFSGSESLLIQMTPATANEMSSKSGHEGKKKKRTLISGKNKQNKGRPSLENVLTAAPATHDSGVEAPTEGVDNEDNTYLPKAMQRDQYMGYGSVCSDSGSVQPQHRPTPTDGVYDIDDGLDLPNTPRAPEIVSFDERSWGDGEGLEIDTEEDQDEYVEDVETPGDVSPSRKRKKWIKRTAGIGRVAKSVKSGTTMTGKQVVKMGKGTVSAGRLIISKSSSVHLHRPPGREPRRRERSKQTMKDHHVAVNKAMKKYAPVARQDTAGQQNPPDQSCWVVSQVLSEMSSHLSPSPQVSGMITSIVDTKSQFGCWFLCGGSVELGVLASGESKKLDHGCLVARCLWDNHWREEWCGLYESHLAFYAPLTKRPVMSLSLLDIQSVQRLDPPSSENPLPGLSFLVIETAWRCHYLAFLDSPSRELFSEKLHTAIFTHSSGEKSTQKDAWSAHMWQGFQTSARSSLSNGRGKWAPISSSNKSKQREILNGRRMCFDLEPFAFDESIEKGSTDEIERSVCAFVEELLLMALSFSSESMDPEDFVRFLDATSRLRCLPFHKLNLSGSTAFCIFVNIYHCLLQHALLLSADGPPSKKTIGHFMRCSCYEIGGDIFSLAELDCCVIRGKMSRGSNMKAPFIEAPKASGGYRLYALGFVDARVNFVLNNGNLTNPPSVPVLTPEHLEDQLAAASAHYLQRQIILDAPRRTIFLPKICDVYRKDFGPGEPFDCVQFCVQYLDEDTQTVVIDMFNDDLNSPVIKYQAPSELTHSNLKLQNFYHVSAPVADSDP